MRSLWLLLIPLTVALGWLAQAAPAPKRKPLPKSITNSIGMKLVLIPAGKFMMGSPRTEKGRSEDEHQHEVEITKPFYMGIYEVTQDEYKKVMGKNPSYHCANGKGKDEVKGLSTKTFPVENVTHEDAVSFCKTLQKLDNKAGKKRTYRLPTEAEWEYACRGPASATKYSAFHHGDTLSSQQANIFGSHNRPCAVGSYKSNGFGLYDMHGNVWELCSDWYDETYYKTSPLRDPGGPSRGSHRVRRGGGWYSFAKDCRSADRYRYAPTHSGITLGFRVVMVPGR